MIINGTYDLLNSSVFEDVLQMNFSLSIDNKLTSQKNFDEAMEYWIENYFYRLNIYFKQGTVEKHQQAVAFSLVDFWWGVGSIGGLWFGASLLSVIELFYLMFILIFDVCKICKAKSKTQSVKAVRPRKELNANTRTISDG